MRFRKKNEERWKSQCGFNKSITENIFLITSLIVKQNIKIKKLEKKIMNKTK